ncbi:unnamed protein product, partial [Owenia fusiformis]
MPVETMLALQSILKNSNSDTCLQELQRFVERGTEVVQLCSRNDCKRIYSILKKELKKTSNSQEECSWVSVILRVVQHLANNPHEPNDAVIFEYFPKMIVETYECISHLLQTSSYFEKTLEDTLETIITLSEYSSRAKGRMISMFSLMILSDVTNVKFSFHIKMEMLKSLNLLLERCPSSVRQQLNQVPEFTELINFLAALIQTIGDYEFQVGVIECLFRLIQKPQRECFAKFWFSDKGVQKAFLDVRDSDFETDCREFLNHLNETTFPRNVFSIPCDAAYLGSIQLEKPQDAKYSEFWVDFNCGSRRITIFCNQEPSESQEEEEDELLWETVSIHHKVVEKYSLEDNIVKLYLKHPVRDLISFGPMIPDTVVTIAFQPHCSIQGALDGTLKTPNKIGQKVSRSIQSIHVNLKTTENEDDYQIPSSIADEQTDMGNLCDDLAKRIADKLTTKVGKPCPRQPKVSMPLQPMAISARYNRNIEMPTTTSSTQHTASSNTSSGRSTSLLQSKPLEKSSQPNSKSPDKDRAPAGSKTPKSCHGVRRVKTPLVMAPVPVEVKKPVSPDMSLDIAERRLKVSEAIAHASEDEEDEDVQECDVDTIPDSCPVEINVSSQPITESLSKEEKIQQVAKLKDKILIEDPNYTGYNKTVYCAAKSPALSNITEEGTITSNDKTPKSVSGLATIKEDGSQKSVDDFKENTQQPTKRKGATKRGRANKGKKSKPRAAPTTRAKRGRKNKSIKDEISGESDDDDIGELIVEVEKQPNPVMDESHKHKDLEVEHTELNDFSPEIDKIDRSFGFETDGVDEKQTTRATRSRSAKNKAKLPQAIKTCKGRESNRTVEDNESQSNTETKKEGNTQNKPKPKRVKQSKFKPPAKTFEKTEAIKSSIDIPENMHDNFDFMESQYSQTSQIKNSSPINLSSPPAKKDGTGEQKQVFASLNNSSQKVPKFFKSKYKAEVGVTPSQASADMFDFEPDAGRKQGHPLCSSKADIDIYGNWNKQETSNAHRNNLSKAKYSYMESNNELGKQKKEAVQKPKQAKVKGHKKKTSSTNEDITAVYQDPAEDAQNTEEVPFCSKKIDKSRKPLANIENHQKIKSNDSYQVRDISIERNEPQSAHEKINEKKQRPTENNIQNKDLSLDEKRQLI